MTELYLKIVDMSISAGWLVLVVLVLRLFLKKHPKWVNVLLWGMVAIRLICPISMKSPFSLMRVDGAREVADDMMYSYVGAGNFYWDHTEEYQTAVQSGIQPSYGGEGRYYVATGESLTTPIRTVADQLSVVWIAGLLALTSYTAVSYFSLRRKMRTAVILQGNVFQCETVDSPFVLGLIRPKIYLPYAMDDQNMEHVIAHEQAHIRRKDHWWKPLGFLLLTIHWFNPLIWVAYILLCRDIELACDEKVIGSLGREQRADYTQALIACSVNRRAIAACPLAFGEVGVKARVKSIMNYRKPTFWVIVTAAVVCVVVAVCFLTNPRDISTPASVLDSLSADDVEWAQITLWDSETEHILLDDSQIQELIGTLKELKAKDFVRSRMAEHDLSLMINCGEREILLHWNGDDTEFIFDSETSESVDADYRFVNSQELNALLRKWILKYDFSYELVQELYAGAGSNRKISFDFFAAKEARTGVTEVRLRNLHNGEDTSITDSAAIDSILSFLSNVKGANAVSSKGYYGGCYEIQIWSGTENVFHMGFGDDESFHYGDYGDGYPTRYELQGVSREDVIRLFLQYDSSGFDWGLGEAASTYEIYNVAPLEELPSTYNLEEATIDKCVILVDGDIRDNEDSWTEFINNVDAGAGAAVRIVHYYHGSDAEPSSMYIFDLTYDGSTYQLRWFEDGKEYIETYQYLRCFNGEAETESAEYDAYTAYVLTDHPTATRQELLLSYASSVLNAAIPHFEVYTNLIYYPDHPRIPTGLAKAELYLSPEDVGEDIVLLESYEEAELLSRMQLLLSSAEALGYTPKTYGVCCYLALSGADGSTVTLGLDGDSDYFVVDGIFYDYGPGYDEDGCLDATADLQALLGLEAWP